MKKIVIIATALLSSLVLTGCEDDFKNTCADMGGVIKEDTKVIPTTTIDPSTGKVLTSTTIITTRFCIVDGEVKMQS